MRTFARVSYAFFKFVAAVGAGLAGVKLFQVVAPGDLVLGAFACLCGFYFCVTWIGDGLDQFKKIGRK